MGLYGKVPAHGDFVRRGLPSSFVGPWDAWLAAGIAAARDRLGPHWGAAWDSAPAWRFVLPPGACGPDPVAGVMLPSQDQVGRRFPITLAALLAPGEAPPDVAWFDALEAAAFAGRAGRADADALSAALPPPGAPILAPAFALPAIAPPEAHTEAPDDAWAPASAGPAAAEDVLALLGGEGGPEPAAPASGDADALAFLMGAPSPPAPAEDGILSGLIGAAPETADWPRATASESAPQGLAEGLAPWMPPAPPPRDTGPAEADGTLAGLLGELKSGNDPDPPRWDAAREEAPSPVPLPAGGTDGTLAGLIGSAADPLPPAGITGDPDGTLMGLIGVSAEPPADAPLASRPHTPLPPDDGTLSGLIGAAASGDGPPPADWAAPGLPGADAGPLPADGPDLLPGLAGAAWPDPAAPADAASLAVPAPPAPEGGGWWTRGGAHVPPMVWPMPGLPDPADFAYLLEAAA
jgi:type VI secretion system protein ImpM